MKTTVNMVIVALSLCATASEPAMQTLTAGAESTVAVPQTGARMKVFLPTNYQPNAKWPVVFFFPGTGGAASTALVRQYTGDRDYIVVGLPYVTPNTEQPLPDFVSRELQNFRAARQWLATHASTDEARVYLGGISKGGWTTTQVGEAELPRLAGLIILLAGRGHPFSVAPGGTAYRGKPIYLGDGETDNNMRPARQATTFYQTRGAAVTFEEYPGIGHAMPQEAPRLRTWLLAQYRYANRDAAAQAELAAWFTNAVAAVKAATEVGEKFRLALDLVRDPRLWLCPPPAGATAQQLLQAATARSPTKEEWIAETTYWSLLWKTTNLRVPEDLRAARDGFLQITVTYPTTRWAKLAAEDHRILADAYTRTMAARTSLTNITTHSGAGTRGIPVPRWSGNKIIFDR
jgi:acetyl esterase/lipase